MVDPSDGLDGLDLGEGGRPDATEVELVPVGEPQPSQPRTSGLDRKHAAIAVAAILASAVLISRAGETVPTATALRTADFSGPELTSANEDEDDDADEVDRYELPSWLEDEDVEAWPYDDELALAEDDYTFDTYDTYDTYDTTTSSIDFDDFDDFDFDDDYDTLPRRASSNPRPTQPRTTSPRPRTNTTTSTTSTTVAETTTTGAETTTTVAGSSTSEATTTTALPTPAWTGAVSGLGSVTCAQPLNVLTRMNSLIASVAGSGLYANAAGTWTALPSSVAGTGEQRALVQTDADTYWIGGAGGVFRRDDGAADFTEVGDLTDVLALSVYVSPANQATMLAVAGAESTLYRWVDGPRSRVDADLESAS